MDWDRTGGTRPVGPFSSKTALTVEDIVSFVAKFHPHNLCCASGFAESAELRF